MSEEIAPITETTVINTPSDFPPAMKVEEAAAAKPEETAAVVDPIVEGENKEESPATVEKTPEEIEAEKAKVEVKAETTEEESWVEGDAANGDDKGEETEEDTTWLKLAEAQGIPTPKGDTYEDYVAAQQEHISAQVETTVATKLAEVEQATIAKALELQSNDPKVYALLHHIDAGGDVDTFINPLKNVYEWKALSDTDLIKKDLELKGYDEEMQEKELAKIIADNSTDHEAKKLRLELNVIEKTISENIAENAKNYKTQVEQQKQQAIQQELTAFKETISKIDVFMGHKVTPAEKAVVIGKFEKERQAFISSPERIAKAMFYETFGAKGEASIKEKSFKEGKASINDKLENKPIKGHMGTRVQVTSPEAGKGMYPDAMRVHA